MARKLLDSNGVEIVAGCHLHFGYGMPPIPVYAEIIERNGKLVALTPGHKPTHALVSKIVRDFDCWVEPHVPSSAALDGSVHCIRCGKLLSKL